MKSHPLLRSAPVLLCLVLAAAAGCKAKMNEPPPEDDVDLMMTVSCEEMKCLDPDAVCCNGDSCIDLKTNPSHCGGCGMACSGQEGCLDGRCVCRGGNGQMTCSGSTSCCPDRPGYTGGCKSLEADNANCGSCGKSCKANESCAGGSCRCGGGAMCAAGQTCCPMGCAETTSDVNNCGMCGRKCAAGKACKNGVCEGECVPDCAAGETCCGGQCANLGQDGNNCGMCGKVCPDFFGMKICLFGFCFDPGGGDGGLMLPDGFLPGDM